MGDKKRPVFISAITPIVAEKILKRENAKLGLDDTVVVDPATALKTLLEMHGSEQGMRLFSYYVANNFLETRAVMNDKINPKTLWRNIDMIKKTGLAPSYSASASRLMPLEINLCLME